MSEEYQDEEIVVGVHESGILLEEGVRTGGRNYCANCKRNVHCHVVVDDGKATIKMTCKNTDCECKCKTCFACKRCGYLHPYGTVCNRSDTQTVRDPKAEKEFQKLMKKWRKQTDVPLPRKK